jgi:hypothetical protein
MTARSGTVPPPIVDTIAYVRRGWRLNSFMLVARRTFPMFWDRIVLFHGENPVFTNTCLLWESVVWSRKKGSKYDPVV